MTSTTPTTLALMPEEQQLLLDRVKQMLALAEQQGASAAEVASTINVGLEVTVRLGEVETVEFNREKSAGITVYFGQRKGSAASSDLSDQALAESVAAACAIAKYTGEDQCAGLADKNLLAFDYPELNLNHPWDIDAQQAIKLALACEDKARAYDKRIDNSDGATVSTSQSYRVYGNSLGFLGECASTYHSLSCMLVASQNGAMQRDYYYTATRNAQQLLTADEVALHAAQRTIQRLGARSLPTQAAPVIFEAPVARGLLGHFISAISGGNLYRKTSFLIDHLGKRIFPDYISLDEDPLLPSAIGSCPFDSDGVRTQPRAIVDEGILASYVLSTYSARKLGMQSTGNASGVHNLMVQTSDMDLPALINHMNRGLLVTELMGQGINIVTGDYSRGASGYWIENGAIQFPVEGITIAGNLRDMFANLVAVANDIDIRGNIRSGSILVEQMMIAGS
ncbi:MAG: metalloprotease PmbA [Gammaproteobacteria bacterium]